MKTAVVVAGIGMVLLRVCNATTYCSFYDDENCSVNGGTAVSVDNPGCLEENAGRGSLMCHGTNVQNVDLVVTNGPGCNCQWYVEPNILSGSGLLFSWTQGCANLNSFGIGAANGIQSYRFVGSVADQPHGTCNSCDGAPQSLCLEYGDCPGACAP